MENRAVVTGANGFVGRHLLRRLLATGFKVTAVSRGGLVSFHPKLNVIKLDLASSDVVPVSLFDDCGFVFHCAGETSDPALMHVLHVEGLKKLLIAAGGATSTTKKSMHWVQLSSVGVYGPPIGDWTIPRTITESSTMAPKGEYEITKAKADELLQMNASDLGLTYSILRPSNIIGEGMKSHALVALAKVIYYNQFYYVGSDNAIATYVHVNDVVEALLACTKLPEASGHIFNISNDCAFSDVVNAIARFLNVEAPRRTLPISIVRIIINVFDGLLPKLRFGPRVAAISSHTSYPTVKIKDVLQCSPRIAIPSAVGLLAAVQLSSTETCN